MAAKSDPHWIEHAHLQRGAYGHHTLKQTRKDAKKGGKLGKRANTALTLRKLAEKKLYPGGK